jgi:hypothetical protein
VLGLFKSPGLRQKVTREEPSFGTNRIKVNVEMTNYFLLCLHLLRSSFGTNLGIDTSG